ncbi:cytochrome b [Oleomonas cavernae]|uniref:Cytochrome b n=1 Tax=Oleomonas cavernae TaxID=2320859 RepID=A0A418WGI7_9PROT|nr:cytochrome b/b6 domain-containing protein [Oleomonas cavernae]RJF88999.1 cytochrome b [Oleomonas cavernae]
MRNEHQPTGYSAAQILLHWLIALLVLFQVSFGEDIAPAYRAMRRDETAGADDLFNADLHIYTGLAILALACLRLAIRLIRGAPPAPESEGILLRWVAAAVHLVLYAVIFLMPVTGILAWYLGVGPAGEIHELGKAVIIIALALHVAGALWQHFIAKSDALVRMLRPGTRGAGHTGAG